MARVSRRHRRIGVRHRRNKPGYVAIPRLLRRRKGKFAKTGRLLRRGVGRAKPRRHKKARRNPGNPWVRSFSYRRRAGKVRVPRHYRRKHARRNPSAGRRRMRLLRNPLEAITSAFQEAFSMDTLETVFQTGLGFGGTVVGSRLLYKKVMPALGSSSLGRIGTTTGTAILGSTVLGMVGGKNLAARALGGGLLAAFWQILSEFLPAEAKEFIPTLGDAESDQFRKAIEQEVLREIRGGGSSDGMSVYLQPAGVSQTYLQPAGASAYLTSNEAREDAIRGYADGGAPGMGAFLTRNEVDRVEGLGDVASEFGGRNMSERF
jgi:hypothetical protein